MNKKIMMVIGVIIVGLAGSYLLGGLGSQEDDLVSEKESLEIAQDFVRNSPTYEFDGSNLNHTETLYPEVAGHPDLYTFVFEFRSSHGGYGDRTGEPVTQVITPHRAHITVDNGNVTNAVLDQEWDMIEQEYINND